MKKILSLGCGQDFYGTTRVDFVKTPATTHVCNLNEPLPFKDGEFDEVYCKSVLEHVGNVKLFISEAMRVLKEGGTFWFRTDNASYIPFLWNNHQDYIKYSHTCKEDRHYYLFKSEHLLNHFIDTKGICTIIYSCPSSKLFFLPWKYKCMHIEIKGRKGRGSYKDDHEFLIMKGGDCDVKTKS